VPVSTRISNLVATGNLKQKLDLNLTSKLAFATYNKDLYHCAYVKTLGMRSKVSVFASGKMISIGTKSEEEARGDLIEAANYLAQNNVVENVDPTKQFQIRNIVLVGQIELTIGLKNLFEILDNAMYEPEQFSGIIHHPSKFVGVSILIFQSGKFVVAGLKSHREIKRIEHYTILISGKRTNLQALT
jgi:transcription initiation factor TFIID TATA-box-binding protein